MTKRGKAKGNSQRRASPPKQPSESVAVKGADITTFNEILENTSSHVKTSPISEQVGPPKQFDYSSVSVRRISAIEWTGVAGLFVSLAVGFVVGALAAAGIIDTGLAQIMLLAALIVMT